MSTNRTTKTAGWVDPRKLPEGPNGRNLCRQCAEEVPKGRRTFCREYWRYHLVPYWIDADGTVTQLEARVRRVHQVEVRA